MGKVKSAIRSKVKGHIKKMKKTGLELHLRYLQAEFCKDPFRRLGLCPGYINSGTDGRTQSDAYSSANVNQLS